MDTQHIYGYKDFSTKFPFIFTGVVLLVGINALPWVWIAHSEWKRYLLVLLLFLGWTFRRMWRIIAKLHYIFTPQGDITIVLPSGKKFLLPAQQIETKEKLEKISSWGTWGIRYLPWKQEIHFTTSTKHLLKIAMKDGRTIVISPKKYYD